MPSTAPSTPTHQLRHDLEMSIPALMPGDLLATSTRAKSSQGIRWATNGVFSHVILYMGNGFAVDAAPWQGVTRQKLRRKLHSAKFAVVFRHRTATEAQLDHVRRWTSLKVNHAYDYSGALRAGIQPGSKVHQARLFGIRLLSLGFDELSAQLSEEGHNQSFYCSELIFRAFQVAGIPLLDKPSRLLGPNQLLKSRELVLMGTLDWRGAGK
ncbi:hypothetical protein [Halospina sp. K52047b]|uniref:hypothetical protein n=1 Tax=Halospina sp. K52047b TaxID=2614160 RepID=UPI001249CB2A|nr:hypothetical protein [Halospina sp. K52047b]KAA8978323.1 hypothetical protein F3089_14000 [Halospina sp. K52047b]